MQQRLQKLIASAGLASRREAEGWIRAGRVRVNGEVATLGSSADPAVDRIEVDGRPLGEDPSRLYLLLNKPLGYVTTLRDPQGRPVVTDLLKGVNQRVFPVGRLDVNTEGLLLLTNDGALANRLTHPRHRVAKTYLVRVRGILSDTARRQLEQGVALEEGTTAPARVSGVRTTGRNSWFELTITEGRNRQVRRMCEAVGHPASRLKRIRVGSLTLEGVEVGSYRRLTEAEVRRLKSS